MFRFNSLGVKKEKQLLISAVKELIIITSMILLIRIFGFMVKQFIMQNPDFLMILIINLMIAEDRLLQQKIRLEQLLTKILIVKF